MRGGDLWAVAWATCLANPVLCLVIGLLAVLLALVAFRALVPIQEHTPARQPPVDMDDVDDYNWIDSTGSMPLAPHRDQP